MKLFATTVADQNVALFDPWTVIHFSVGLFAGLVGIPVAPSMAAAVGYEAFEQIAENQPWGQKIFRTSGSETVINLVSDVVIFGVGWYLGDRYHGGGRRKANPALPSDPKNEGTLALGARQPDQRRSVPGPRRPLTPRARGR